MSSPPRYVFDWHYLQCVYQRFGTTETTGVGHIYPKEPVQSGAIPDNEHDVRLPSSAADAIINQVLEHYQVQRERFAIARWSSGVSVGHDPNLDSDELCGGEGEDAQ